jgi:hypothetical protein
MDAWYVHHPILMPWKLNNNEYNAISTSNYFKVNGPHLKKPYPFKIILTKIISSNILPKVLYTITFTNGVKTLTGTVEICYTKTYFNVKLGGVFKSENSVFIDVVPKNEPKYGQPMIIKVTFNTTDIYPYSNNDYVIGDTYNITVDFLNNDNLLSVNIELLRRVSMMTETIYHPIK